MKHFTKSILSVAFTLAWGGAFAATHVIDLRTGIDNNTGLKTALLSPDDDWDVKEPGAANFQDAYCGSGVLGSSTSTPAPYAGLDTSVRWICPQAYLNGAGHHTDNAPGGTYEYRFTFELEPCEVQSAKFNFWQIGADNEIKEIIVNGSSYTVSYGFNPFGSGILFIAPGDIASGTNTIVMKVENLGQHTGMKIDGNLTIADNSPSPNFTLTYFNGMLQGQGDPDGEHQWEVYCTPTGNSGPYTHITTFNTPSFSMDGECECYFVTHSSFNECWDECSSMSVCASTCEDMECSLAAPTGLSVTQLDPTHHQFTWNAIPGATYVLVLFLQDPACCGSPGGGATQAPPQVDFPVNVPSETVDLDQLNWPLSGEGDPYCYSWLVYAICDNGAQSMYSELHCSSDAQRPAGESNGGPTQSDAGHTDAGSTLGGAGTVFDSGLTTARIYPNPAQDNVMLELRSVGDGEVNISVADISGKTVKSFNNLVASNGRLSLKWNTASLDKGTYLVNITTPDQRVITERLVVE